MVPQDDSRNRSRTSRSSRLRFFKLQGAGNDFVLLDTLQQPLPIEDASALARRLCDRRFGVGADGLLLVEPSERADYQMRIFNADGSEASMCGNGIRCFARYLWEQHPSRSDCLTIETGAGLRRVHQAEGELLTVEMGCPHPLTLSYGVREGSDSPQTKVHGKGTAHEFERPAPSADFSNLTPLSPLSVNGEGGTPALHSHGSPSPFTERGLGGEVNRTRKTSTPASEIEVALCPPAERGNYSPLPRSGRGVGGEGILSISAVNTGAPHLVLIVRDLENFPLETVGPALERHPDFPDRVNVSVAQVERPDYARARVWERGVGATLACGTGACAILVAGVSQGLMARRATVQMPGGALQVEWREDDTLWLTGDAVLVFEGVWRAGVEV